MTNFLHGSAPSTGEFLICTGEDGKVDVQVRPTEGSVWMKQRQIAEVLRCQFRRSMSTWQGYMLKRSSTPLELLGIPE